METKTIAEQVYIAEKNRTVNIHKPIAVNIVRIGKSYYHILKYKDQSLAFKNDPSDFYRNEEFFNYVHFGQDF